MASVDEVCSNFLSAAPPGQFSAIKSSLTALNPQFNDDAVVEAAALRYSSKNARVVMLPSGANAVLCQESFINSRHFYDPKTGEVYKIDHCTLAVEPSSAAALAPNSALEPLRLAIQAAMEQYLQRRFPTKGSAVGVYAKNSVITVAIVAENASSKNMWGGSWSSTWTINCTSAPVVKGVVEIKAHFFEDSNIQLNTIKASDTKTLAAAAPEATTADLVAFIQLTENDIQRGLDEMYASMADETFRAIRRTMPITRTKMEWNMNSLKMNRMVTAPKVGMGMLLPGMGKK